MSMKEGKFDGLIGYKEGLSFEFLFSLCVNFIVHYKGT